MFTIDIHFFVLNMEDNGKEPVMNDSGVYCSGYDAKSYLGRVPLAESIRLILLIRAIERDVPADRIRSSGTSENGDPNRSNMADALATF